MANPDDLWMHVRGMPGSHALLRVPDGSAPSDADVRFAADLAAFFSKGRNETKAEVIVTRAANVRKPKGARPGQVVVVKEKSIVARPSASAAAVAGEAS